MENKERGHITLTPEIHSGSEALLRRRRPWLKRSNEFFRISGDQSSRTSSSGWSRDWRNGRATLDMCPSSWKETVCLIVASLNLVLNGQRAENQAWELYWHLQSFIQHTAQVPYENSLVSKLDLFSSGNPFVVFTKLLAIILKVELPQIRKANFKRGHDTQYYNK